MSCCDCFKKKKPKQKSSDELEMDQAVSEDTKIMKGQMQIRVQKMAISMIDSVQCVVIGCANRLKTPKFKIMDEAQEQLRYAQVERHKYGECITLNGNQFYLIMIPMPLYSGKKDEQFLKETANRLKQEIETKRIMSLAVSDIGVKHFGFPRKCIVDFILELISILNIQYFNVCSEDLYFIKTFLEEYQTQNGVKIPIYQETVSVDTTQGNDQANLIID